MASIQLKRGMIRRMLSLCTVDIENSLGARSGAAEACCYQSSHEISPHHCLHVLSRDMASVCLAGSAPETPLDEKLVSRSKTPSESLISWKNNGDAPAKKNHAHRPRLPSHMHRNKKHERQDIVIGTRFQRRRTQPPSGNILLRLLSTSTTGMSFVPAAFFSLSSRSLSRSAARARTLSACRPAVATR